MAGRRAAVWEDLPRRKAGLQLGFDLLPWAAAAALERLAELSAHPGAVGAWLAPVPSLPRPWVTGST